MAEPRRRIDAHHHLWDLSVRPQPWIGDLAVLDRTFGAAELGDKLAEADIRESIVMQCLCREDETLELLALAESTPFISGVVGWIDITGDVVDAVARLRSAPGGSHLVSIRHQVQFEQDRDWLSRPEAIRGLKALENEGLAYDAAVRPEQLGSVLTAARRVSGLRMVLNHLGNPTLNPGLSAEWRAITTALANLPNVAVKLTGLTNLAGASWTVETLRQAVEISLEEFGAGRVMFGSDWPVCLLTADYATVYSAALELCAELSDGERDDVFGLTATHWYAL